MRKYWLVGMVAISLVVGFSACQAVFTFSPVSFLATDISNVTDAQQQITLAKAILSTGSAVQIQAAYDAINANPEISDPTSGNYGELNSVAADLAFGASGVTDLFNEVMADPTVVSSGTGLQSVLDSLTPKLSLIQDGATHVQNAVAAGVDVSSSQFAIAGASLLASAVAQAGSFDAAKNSSPGDPGYSEYQSALSYFSDAGVSDLVTQYGF